MDEDSCPESSSTMIPDDDTDDVALQPSLNGHTPGFFQQNDDLPHHSFLNGTLSCAYGDMEYFPRKLAERYGKSATCLDLTGNELKSLIYLEQFTAVSELILDNNGLKDGLSLPPMIQLKTLSLNKNELTDVEMLIEEIKEKTPNISYLSLLGNVACPNELNENEEEDYRRYRRLVLYHLPNLKFLDASKVTSKEIETARQAGNFVTVLRLNEQELLQQQRKLSASELRTPSVYSPLPNNEKKPEETKANLSKCRYVYYGRHSEGNRFIRDGDL
eukprot:gene7444-9786_t